MKDSELQESATYQAMLTRVEAIVNRVAQPDLDLDQMVHDVEEGYELIKKMRDRLEVTKSKIDQLQSQYEAKP